MPHNHQRRHRREANPEPKPAATTKVSIVYVTASPTFDGPIAGYSTLGEKHTTSAYTTSYYVTATIEGDVVSWLTTETIGAAAVANPTPTTDAGKTKTKNGSAATGTESPSTSVVVDTASGVTKPSTTLAESQTSVLNAQTTFQTSASVSNTVVAASSATDLTTTTSSSHSSGLSGSGIAGIIIGMLGFAFAAWAIFWCVTRRNKKKKAAEQAKEQEKEAHSRNDILAATAKRSPSNATAPQLHAIRPMTEFGSSFNGNAESIAMSPTSPKGSHWERNMSEKMEMNKANPFGTHAAASSNENNQSNPFGNHAATPEGEKILAAGAIAAAASARRSSRELPKPLDISKSANVQGRNANNSPTGSMTSTSSGMFSDGSPGPSNVHRVQIDFNPSLPDEIGLTAGQLVRLLHAYDDGWCEVTQLNGAAKGICPRTCLSNRPIKPRPRGPQQPGRPMTPTQQRIPIIPQPHSPVSSMHSQATGNQSPVRLMTPGQARPMTPGSGVPQSPMFARPQTPTMSQGHPQLPVLMSQAPLSMSPVSARPASPASTSSGFNKALPLGPDENRSRSPSVSQNQTVRKNLPGTSSLSLATSAQADQPSIGNESSISETTPPPTSPLSPSSIPLPATPVGRKPVPGQAL